MVTPTLLDVIEAVLQLEHLRAVAALDSNLVDDIVQVAVLLFRHKGVLALAAAGTTL